MKTGPGHVPDAEIAAVGAECRTAAVTAMRERDWRGVYEWTKSWVSRGGGAWFPETWLIYATSGIFHGQPRSATHTCDMALQTWIADPADRAMLHWARGQVTRLRVRDPKSALADFAAAAIGAPDWLQPDLVDARQACESEAAVSRVRKPRVKPAPGLRTMDTSFVVPAVVPHTPGAQPELWSELRAIFSART
jgi:hypothetical protein